MCYNIFANHEINDLVFAQDILIISYEIDPPIHETWPIDNGVEFPDVNEVAGEDEVVDHAFMDRENIESRDYEDDVASGNNEDAVADNDDFEERNKRVNNYGSLWLFDDDEVSVERKYPTRFNIKEQIPYFSLG